MVYATILDDFRQTHGPKFGAFKPDGFMDLQVENWNVGDRPLMIFPEDVIGKIRVPLGWYPSCLTPQEAL